VGFHPLTTTTHPPNIKLPFSGQLVTSRLSAHKVSVTGGTGPKVTSSGTLQLVNYCRAKQGGFNEGRQLDL